MPNAQVVKWAEGQDFSNLYISAVNEAELRFGAEILPVGRRRNALLEEIELMLAEDFARRILPFDSGAARAYAVIAANRRAAGRTINHSDCMIAAIARDKGAAVATRDVGDFDGVGIDVINPWSR